MVVREFPVGEKTLDIGGGVWMSTKVSNTGKEDGIEDYECEDLAKSIAVGYAVTKAKDAKDASPPNLDQIVKMLEGHQHSAEKRLDQIAEREKLLAKTFKKLKKDDPQVKFLKRREERKLAKDKAVQTSTMTALKDAIKDIKNKDAKGLVEAKKALQASMEALQEQNGEFLHFLQTTAPGFSCPYCGAQCIDKCVSTEHKTMSGCLAECLAKNPTEGK